MLRVSGRLEKIPAEALPNRNHPRAERRGRSIDGRPIQAMAANNSFRRSTATSAATLATPATTRAGRAPDIGRRTSNALELRIHGVRTHWIRGFMAFQLGRRTRNVVPMVL